MIECNRGPDGGPCLYFTEVFQDGQCRACWLNRYRPESTMGRMRQRSLCEHLGDPTGEVRVCGTCAGNVRIKLRRCQVHTVCTLEKQVEGAQCCIGCPDYKRRGDAPVPTSLTWMVGVTTVPSRMDNLLPQTLRSLEGAGFFKPRLFVDRCSLELAQQCERRFGLPVTARDGVGCPANWVLTLWELYARDPDADRFAIFQDDILLCRNVKEYLDRTEYPERGYWNLYAAPSQQWIGRGVRGFIPSTQHGKGALALVFSREAVATVLSAEHMVRRFQDKKDRHERIDGGIVDSFKKAGWKEHVHSPSLALHTGIESSMGKKCWTKPEYRETTFPGEDYDALALLKTG